MGFFIKREYFRPEASRLQESALRVGPGASYYALSMGRAAIGYSASTRDTTAAGIMVQNNTVFDIQALGNVQRTGITQIFNLTRTMRLIDFDATLQSDAATFHASGRVSGDTLLDMTVQAGGPPQHSRIRLTEPMVMAELVNLQLALGGQMRTGQSFTVRTFDPLTMQMRDVGLTVLAESSFVVPDSAVFDSTSGRWVAARYDTLAAFKVAQTVAGMSFEAWIDAEGSIIRATSPIGITVDRTAFEIAVQNYRIDRRSGVSSAAGAGSDVISTTAIAANVTLRPEALAVLRLRLGNVSLGGFDLSGGRQSLSGDTLTITREAGFGDAPAGGARPGGFEQRLPFVGTGDTAVAAALQPEPLVQSDDPRIQALARQIIGRERRAGAVAELLTRWVYGNLEKKITISVPSASQVLETRSGDCNEHTVLYVALARAAGLPARTAAGVVYLRGQFYYHAWPEVWLGQWVAVDPTFGQFPADAAHLRFIIGGLARQVELIRLIGRLQIEVVR